MGEAAQAAVHVRQRRPQRGGDARGEDRAQFPHRRPRRVGREHLAEGGACAAAQKILHPLHGGGIRLPARAEGGPLERALERDAVEGVPAVKIGEADLREQRAVRVDGVARVVAHAVGDDAARLARRGHDIAARAHAKRERRALARVADQLVVGDGQRAARAAVLGKVDVRLQVLDAHPDGELARLHGEAAFQEHTEGVARGMADRQNELARVRTLFPTRRKVAQYDAPQRAAAHDDVLQPAMEAHLSPVFQDVPPHVAHHRAQAVAADVRLVEIGDFGRGAELDEGVEHLAVARVARLRVEFAVRKGPRAALAELDVAVLVEDMFAEEALVLRGALLDRAAALDDERADARTEQADGAKQPGRAAARHDHARGPARYGGIGARRRHDRPAVRLHAVHPADVRFVARVQRLFQDADIRTAAQLFGREADELFLAFARAQAQIIDAHIPSPRRQTPRPPRRKTPIAGCIRRTRRPRPRAPRADTAPPHGGS